MLHYYMSCSFFIIRVVIWEEGNRDRCGWGKGCQPLGRERYGHYTTLLKELRTEDEKAFFNDTRLPRGLFDEVLRQVEGRIEKKDTWYRKALSPRLKLSITLRHLACGDKYPSLSFNFRVAPNTISLVINEVCDVITAEYAAEVIQCPTTTEEWAAIADQFEKRWQFPHCCRTIDGKHVAISCPWNTGSTYRNYKGFFSIVHMHGLSRRRLQIPMDWYRLGWLQQWC